MALILGIESTCDETAAAVVRDGREVFSSAVATQFELHAKFRGVVPEIASRAHIENILPVLQEACSVAGVTLDQIDAVAVAHRPGLIGSLLIGVTAAKTLAYLLHKPLIGVDHVQAHLYSVVLGPIADCGLRIADLNAAPQSIPQLQIADRKSQIPSSSNPQSPSQSPISFPAAGAVLSGGHTALYRVDSWTDIALVGSTIDDAIGEAYDKVAATLGLPFPGGPTIDRLAASGNSKAVRFPRSYFEKDSLDFSFSGLKTAVLYHALGPKGTARTADQLGDADKADIAASFQAACLDVVEEKLKRLARQINARCVVLGGGVTSNKGLRARLANFPIPVHFPEPQYCTDNAVMSAGLADVLLREGLTSTLDLDAITFSSLR